MEKFKTASLAALMMFAIAGCEGETGSLGGDTDSNQAPSPEVSADPVLVNNFQATQVTILANDPDANDTHTYALAFDASIGAAAIDSSTGVLSYFPSNSEQDYTDSAVVTVTDAEGLEGSVTVIFYVGNITPVLMSAGNITVDAGSSSQTTLAVSDVNSTDTHTFSISGQPILNGATAQVVAGTGNTATLTYNAGSAGSDLVTVQVTDSGGASSTVNVLVTVNDTIDPNQSPVPTAQPSAFTVDASAQTTIQISANDPDTSDTHTYSLTSSPALGSVSISASGLVTYTAGSVAGNDAFIVSVADNSGASNTVTITGTVNAVETGGGSAARGETLVEELGCNNAFCHGADLSFNNILTGTTAAAIDNAIQTVASMSSFRNADISQQDLEDMAAYIQTF